MVYRGDKMGRDALEIVGSDARFEDFFNHDFDAIDEAARLLADLQRSYENGEISKRQFLELSEDILQFEEVDDAASKLENKATFDKAISALRAIVGIVAKLA